MWIKYFQVAFDRHFRFEWNLLWRDRQSHSQPRVHSLGRHQQNYTHRNDRFGESVFLLFTFFDSHSSCSSGLLISAMTGAASSTFDSTVNAGAAYWSNDIYNFINKNASQKTLVWHSRVASIIIVMLGLLPVMFINNINIVWGKETLSRFLKE